MGRQTMGDYYFSVNLDNYRSLCIAPLTNRQLAISGQEVSDVSGYFLFEKRGCGESAEIDILAQATSEEAAFRLRELFRMS
jgi:hypothetical protein